LTLDQFRQTAAAGPVQVQIVDLDQGATELGECIGEGGVVRRAGRPLQQVARSASFGPFKYPARPAALERQAEPELGQLGAVPGHAGP
jgi:hypothetical protein